MTLNHDFIGRKRTSPEPYEVCREAIREYAVATCDLHPAYLDPEAARELGHPDVIAPPSFPFVLFFRFGGWPMFDPEFGKRREPVCVMRSQRLTCSRPVRAGDRLLLHTTVNDVYDVGPHEQFVLTHRVTTVEGEPVCTMVDTIVSRGTAATVQGEAGLMQGEAGLPFQNPSRPASVVGGRDNSTGPAKPGLPASPALFSSVEGGPHRPISL